MNGPLIDPPLHDMSGTHLEVPKPSVGVQPDGVHVLVSCLCVEEHEPPPHEPDAQLVQEHVVDEHWKLEVAQETTILPPEASCQHTLFPL